MSPTPLQSRNVTISIDLELAWGNGGKKAFLPLHAQEREHIHEFLKLCAEFGISCTWATVGNLMLENKAEAKRRDITLYGNASRVYNSIDGAEQVLWFGADIIEMITSCKAPQEIGCHSFFHTLANETDEVSYRSELMQCHTLAQEKYGLKLTSFVYPRNIIGHEQTLKEVGFVSFRDAESQFTPLRRVIDTCTLQSLPYVYASVHSTSLVLLPASYFLGLSLIKRMRPPRVLLVNRLAKSVRNMPDGATLHVWFHPHNLVTDPKYWFTLFRVFFGVIREQRERGQLGVSTMEMSANATTLCV